MNTGGKHQDRVHSRTHKGQESKSSRSEYTLSPGHGNELFPQVQFSRQITCLGAEWKV
jgi:hypothetical protein